MYVILFMSKDKVMFPATLRANGTDNKGFLLNTIEVHLSFFAHVRAAFSSHPDIAPQQSVPDPGPASLLL